MPAAALSTGLGTRLAVRAGKQQPTCPSSANTGAAEEQTPRASDSPRTGRSQLRTESDSPVDVQVLSPRIVQNGAGPRRRLLQDLRAVSSQVIRSLLLLVRSSDRVDADAAVAGCSFRTRAATRPSLAPIAESGAGADVCRTGQLLLQRAPDAPVPRPNWPARDARFRVSGMLPNQAANSGGRRPRALVRPRQAYQQERHRPTRRTSRDRRP